MFANRPPTDEEKAFRILRVEAASKLAVTITCREFRGVWSHWTGKSNVVCVSADTCKSCARGVTRRWNGYVSVQSEATGARALLHFTPPVAEYLLAFSQHTPFLLGLQIVVSRSGPLKNGQLSCRRQGINPNVIELEISDLEWQIAKLYDRSAFVELRIASEA